MVRLSVGVTFNFPSEHPASIQGYGPCAGLPVPVFHSGGIRPARYGRVDPQDPAGREVPAFSSAFLFHLDEPLHVGGIFQELAGRAAGDLAKGCPATPIATGFTVT